MSGQQGLAPDPAASWIDLSSESDELGRQRAFVHLVTNAADTQLWLDMDTAAFQVAGGLGKQPGDVEYWNAQVGAWQPAPPPIDPVTGGP